MWLCMAGVAVAYMDPDGPLGPLRTLGATGLGLVLAGWVTASVPWTTLIEGRDA